MLSSVNLGGGTKLVLELLTLEYSDLMTLSVGSPLTRFLFGVYFIFYVRGIFQVLGLMKMDMVNYTIQSLQPHLQEHSIQHERATFQELLNKQPSM